MFRCLRLGIIVLLVLMSSHADAFSYTVRIEFTEGVNNGNLALTRIEVEYWTLDRTKIKRPSIDIPASNPDGGSPISYPMTFSDIDGIVWIHLYARSISTDTPPLRSDRSNVVIHTINRTRPRPPR